MTDKIGQVAQFSKVGAGRGNEGGISAAAREIGVERTEVRRAEKVASISDDAKEAAREAGLDDNQSVLLKVARVEPARQASVFRRRDDALLGSIRLVPPVL
ncbi:MAG: hypothetical protein WDN46_12715 [Methylocella sp.]